MQATEETTQFQTERQLKEQNEGEVLGLSEREQNEAEERMAVGAHVVFAAIRKEGDDELTRTTPALAWSGLAAGLSMGFSFIVQALLHAGLPDAPWRPLVGSLGYSVGFLIVILGRQQLFTENTVTPILPLLERRDLKTLRNVLRLWGVVLLTNLVGALIIALVLAHTNVFDANVHQAFNAIGLQAVRGDFLTTMLRAVFAGWLLALMVWLLPAAEAGRVWVIIIITYVVGLGGFSHIVAGSIEVFYLAVAGQAGWDTALLGFVVPTLIGNILGGVSLVAALNYAQVVKKTA